MSKRNSKEHDKQLNNSVAKVAKSIDDVIPSSNDPEIQEKSLMEHYTTDTIVTSELTKDASDPTSTIKQVTKQSRQRLKDMTDISLNKTDISHEQLGKIYEQNTEIATNPPPKQTPKQAEGTTMAFEQVGQFSPNIKVKPIQPDSTPIRKHPLFYKTVKAVIGIIILIVVCVALFAFLKYNNDKNAKLQQQIPGQPLQQQIPGQPLQQPLQPVQQVIPTQTIIQPIAPVQPVIPQYVQTPIQTQVMPIVQNDIQQPLQTTIVPNVQNNVTQSIVGGTKQPRLRDAKGRFIKSK